MLDTYQSLAGQSHLDIVIWQNSGKVSDWKEHDFFFTKGTEMERLIFSIQRPALELNHSFNQPQCASGSQCDTSSHKAIC